jgi:peptidoglycan/xylan/chitin deacetylase (PgdA/CDA1 family)
MGKSKAMSSASTPTESWPWPPAMRASAAWHVAAIGAGVLVPGALPWAIGAIVLNHALITGAGLTPRSSLLGPNVTRLPEAAAARREVAITIDDGPEPEVTPQVLDLLDAHGQRATFFCIAERVLKHPELAREIVARGHSIQNHTAQHRHNFSFLGPRGFAKEIARAQDILTEATGQRPTCFRAPAGLRNPFLEPVLHPPGPVARELDAPWFRHARRRPCQGDGALEPQPAGARHPVAARRQRRAHRRRKTCFAGGIALVARTPARRWIARCHLARRAEVMSAAPGRPKQARTVARSAEVIQ